MVYLIFVTVDDLDLDDLLGDLDNGGNGYKSGSGGDNARIGKPLQRPKTSHGMEAPVASGRRLSKLSTDSELFSPLDGTPHEPCKEKAPATKEVNTLALETPPAATKQAGSASPAQRRQSSSVTDDVFDDDGDLLSGMGLGDEGSKNPVPLTTTTTRKKSVTSAPLMDGSGGQPTDKSSFGSDDFFSSLGQRLHSSNAKGPAPVTGSGTKQEESENGDSDGFQFGAYVPSSAVGRKSSLKQQQQEASVVEEDSVNQLINLSVRPNTAPGKKAVRFAEDLATAKSPRPATSPGLQLTREKEDGDSGGTGPRSSEGGQKRRSTVSEFSFSNPDTRFVFTASHV